MIESVIISNLVYNEEYMRKVIPFLKEEYFDENSYRKIYATISSYVDNYNEPPTMEALKIALDKRTDINEQTYKDVEATLQSLKVDSNTNQQWLLDETERFCQDKDLYNSIRKSILILDGKEKDLDKGSIPKLLSDSLGISFDSNVGHDFFDDVESRFKYYHKTEERIAFDIEILNRITRGGLPRKSMTVLLAVTGGGKSLVKCHMAASSLMMGKNVLYITMEMPEEEIAKRIDMNILDLTYEELKEMSYEAYSRRLGRYKGKTPGRLKIKEYPTGSAHSGHFRHLLNEMKLKENFVPDIIFIDYLNICCSSRIKGAAASNSYNLVKAISEEVRGLAMEFDVPVVTSSQFNRAAYDSSDVDLTNVSESMGIAHSADCILGLVTNEELESINQIMFKQLKNRWNDLNFFRRFNIGIDRSRMKLYSLEESAMGNIQSEPTATKNFAELKQKTANLFDVGKIK